MACHFITALNVPGLGRTKARLRASSSAQEELGEFDESLNIDISMEIEASADDVDTMRTAYDVTFEAGDVVGKLMAFIAQIRSCSYDTREYLMQIAVSLGCPSWEIKLWVRTRWGSLSDCFRTVLAIQKVCQYIIIPWLVRLQNRTFQAIDRFCRLADDDEDLPPLANGNKWANYLLSGPEWEIIRLAQDCLEVYSALSWQI
jgi:hypothetical protein